MHLSIDTWIIIFAQLLLAVVCGGAIGYQRELLDRPAGFRTHILVCVGSAVYMLVSYAVAGNQYDPGRIAAQVASGIGFLGAGTIIKQGSIVRGLTTAASLWAVAGIGLAVGAGGSALGIAVMGTIVVLISLIVLKRIEQHIDRRHQCLLSITATHPRAVLKDIREELTAREIEQFGVTIAEEQPDGSGQLSIEIRSPRGGQIDEVITALTAMPEVKGVQWRIN